MLKHWSIPLVLLFCVGVTAWLANRLDPERGAPRKAASHEPDSYMKEFTRTAMDENGNIKNRLRATLMTHFPDDDSSELVSPRLEIYNGDAKPWNVTADRAWASAHHDVILLYGPVNAWRPDDVGGREVEVITSDVRVLPETKYAESEHPTTITTAESVTHGVGMRARLGINRLELLERVKSRYERKQRG